MANTTSPLAVPLTNGVVRSFAQVRVDFAGLPLNGGIASIKRSRKRNPEMVRSNNADPVGKTTGDNDFEASVTVFYDWYTAMIQTLINNYGPGYGDQQFRVHLRPTSETISSDSATSSIGCTFDSDVGDFSAGVSLSRSEIDSAPAEI